jgi:hypothetical protein
VQVKVHQDERQGTVADLFQTLVDLVTVALRLVVEILQLGLTWSLLLVWIAWWLWAVNWKKAWQVLAQGAWAPVALVSLMAAGVWSQVRPSDLAISPSFSIVNFWWQLGAVCLLVGSALLCGWLQGYFGWTPAEIDVEPPAHHEDHHADAAHAHH